jgi:hypothetical protein
MQKEITDPIEQERIVSEFAARSEQERTEKKKRKAWTQQTVVFLSIALVMLILDGFSGSSRFIGSSDGIHQFRIMGILFLVLWLGLLGAKLGAIEEKLDRLSDTEKK